MLSKKGLIYISIFLYHFIMYGQDKNNVSGTIIDLNTKEPLIGATIYIEKINRGTATDEQGYFSISLPKDIYTIKVEYIGYKTKNITFDNTKIKKLDIALEPDSEKLDDLIIIKRTNNISIKKPEMSINKLTAKEIQKIPVVLGESDILKSILLLPGVTNNGEGSSGFNVRGGTVGQNLILLDGGTIFNSSHLFGFFSIFNSDAVNDLKLYKGGIPARFGGRASSVLEIHQKDGNENNYQTSGGIGPVSSRLLFEGPLIKDKASFLIAARSSYAHLFLKLTDIKSIAYFYDLNTKLSYKINNNNDLYLSGYFGRDVFKFDNLFDNTFGNTMTNLQWKSKFTPNLYLNTSLIYSDYYYGLDFDFVGFNWISDIKNYSLKFDFSHYISEKLKIKYGMSSIYYNFNPGKIYPTKEDAPVNFKVLEKKYAMEPSLYLESEHEISEKITINYGLRYASFYRLGSGTLNVYENNDPIYYNPELKIYEEGKIIDSKTFSSGEIIKNFHNIEPRFSISYAFNQKKSFKASYNKITQYLHLISNTASPTPLDIWTPSGTYLNPEIVDQIAVGYFQDIRDGQYSLETEMFYKKGKNKVDYVDGAELVANESIERVILNGKSRAYGIEILFKKNTDKLTGWIAYTLSKSEQQTPGKNPNEVGINNGKWYRSNYDKLHDFSINASYELNPKWTFNGSFTIQSGRPVTYPNGQYEYLGLRIPSFGNRNSSNLPTFHHLDISVIYIPKPNSTKKWKGEWVFGIYNIYNRKNAASISFKEKDIIGQNESVKFSIFGIVPSFTYNFKF